MTTFTTLPLGPRLSLCTALLLGGAGGCTPSSGADPSMLDSEIAGSKAAEHFKDSGATAPVTVNLSPDLSGIRFDDVLYSTRLSRLLVPGAATGKLFLIDPDSLAVSSISGFTVPPPPPPPDGGTPPIPRGGITSVAEDEHLLYASNRTDLQLYVIDPRAGHILNKVPLGGSPDYVRNVPTTNELWVTEPDDPAGIEVFSIKHDQKAPQHITTIPIAGGPEGLYINTGRKMAYTNQSDAFPEGAPKQSWVLELRQRSALAKFDSGCTNPKGVVGDDESGLAMFGCGEGGLTVVEVTHGKMVAKLVTPTNVDSFGFSPKLRHVYIPGPTLIIAGLSRNGTLTKLGEVVTPGNPTKHAIADDRGHAWVLLGDTGQVLRVTDTYPPTR